MKSKRVKILAVAAAVVLIVAAALAQGMHRHGGPMGGDFPFGGHMLGYFSDVLDLTQAQQDQVKAILEKEKPTIKPLMQQLMQAHQELNKLEDSGTFDETKVRALVAQQTPNITELFVQKARIQAELMQVLTAEQKTKLQQLRAKHEARFEKHMRDQAADTTSN